MKINRLIAGVGLVGLFAAGVVRNNPPVSRQVGFGVQRHDVQPSMPAGNVLGTQWFCPGAQINPDGSVTATVVDTKLLALWDANVHTPALRWGM